MPAHIPIVLLLCALAVIAWAIARDREIFRITVQRGRTVRVKGRIPPSLLNDLQAILANTECSGMIIALPEGDRVRLSLEGSFGPPVDQRLRNAAGLYPKARLKNAPRR